MVRLLVLIIVALLPSLAIAKDRYALVIGNDAYLEVSVLEKAVADAEAVEAELAALGFETILALNVGRRDLNIAIADFTQKLSPGDTAVVFFAGHGAEIDGEIYLLPTDIIAPSDVQKGLISSESVALSSLLERVRRTGARTTVAFIDACRDNPFATKAGRSIGSARGLARIAAPEGTFIVYSAGAGQQALDKLDDEDTNANSVFTRNLLPKLSQPGLEIRDLVSQLRLEVRDLARTRNHAQFPAYYDELLGNFYFNASSSVAPAPTQNSSLTEQTAAAQQPEITSSIRDDFEIARQVGTAVALRSFVAKYQSASDDFRVVLAEEMLAELTTADAETEPNSERAATKAAAVPSDARERVRQTQIELNRVGCAAGVADGIIGRRTRNAFANFISQNGSSPAAAELGSPAALEMVREASGTVCQPAPQAVAPSQTAQQATQPQSTGPTLAGRWRFSYNCAILVSGIGTSTITKSADGNYVSSYKDANGNVGSASYRRNGWTYTGTTRNAAARASETVYLSADGNSYSATNSLGCKSTGERLR